MNLSLIACIALAFVPFLALVLYLTDDQDRLPQKYKDRKTQLHLWSDMFHSASDEELKAFLLTIVTKGFKLNSKFYKYFKPSDILIEVLEARYGANDEVDPYEWEELKDILEEEFGVAKDVWHERITLGELFRASE